MTLAHHPMIVDPRPFVRWWWFSGEIERSAIDEQLRWVAVNGFGGVEIAWVYPHPDRRTDSGPRFLDDEWQALVLHAISGARELGLGCDLTFGSLWPFGGTFVPPAYAAKTFDGPSRQTISRNWESRYAPEAARVIDHLDRRAFRWYAEHLGRRGFARFIGTVPPCTTAFFCDSLEIETESISSDRFRDSFAQRSGYRLSDDARETREDPDVIFDYRDHVSSLLLSEFYEPYTDACHEMGALARVQAHGALTDLIRAYGYADIPETETMLFDPEFATIPASAAAIHGKPIVSAESFTCLYGWVPLGGDTPHLGEESIEDLRCVADAQFAAGVNAVVWHGMPFSTPEEQNRFYATVHVGRDGSLAPSIPEFNAYLAQTSEFMRCGTSSTRMGLYLPIEDMWMKDAVPTDRIKPSNHFFWEMQEVHVPDELKPWRPIWISGGTLEQFRIIDGVFDNGVVTFPVLVIDVEWMTMAHLQEIMRLQRAGGALSMVRRPREPGKRKHREYDQIADRVYASSGRYDSYGKPLLESAVPLDFWCRRCANRYRLFVNHPQNRGLRLPLTHRFSHDLTPVHVPVTFHHQKGSLPFEIRFGDAGGIAIEIDTDTGTITAPIAIDGAVSPRRA